MLIAHKADGSVRIRLTRKLSNALNDIDLRPFRVGDIVELATADANMLIAEGWAERVNLPPIVATADDRGPRRRRDGQRP